MSGPAAAEWGRGGPGALPTPLTPFVPRPEIGVIADLLALPDARLVTLVGPGGVGKTRLGLAVAETLGVAGVSRPAPFPDGVVFVPLNPVRDPALVPFAVASGLGLTAGDRPAAVAVRDHLGARRTLLVLDGVEGVLAATPWIGELVARCPGLRVLATSRSRLGVTGEFAFPVLPLALPDAANLPPLDRLADLVGVRLFALRAAAVGHGFALTAETAPVVVELCRRVDGLPLAIELAAARTRLFSLPVLLDRLDHRLTVLTGGSQDAPERLRTMRGAIAWSHDLLSPPEQVLFRRLAVFPAGFTVEAAEAVAGVRGSGFGDGTTDPSLSPNPDPRTPPLDLLTSLVDQSLIAPAAPAGGDARFAMLDTIREFGLERLVASGEEERVGQAAGRHALGLAAEAEDGLTGPDQEAWLERLSAEHANLGAALERADGEAALRLGGALWRYWARRGFLREGRRWLERALTLGRDAAPVARAAGLHALDNLALDLSDYPLARDRFAEALRLRREAGDRRGVSASLTGLALTTADQGDLALAETLHAESLAIERELGDRLGEAISLHNLGRVAAAAGDHGLARERLLQALRVQRELGNADGVAYVSWALGEALAGAGDPEAAPLLDRALARFRATGDRLGEAHVLLALGGLAAAAGAQAAAAARFRASLARWEELGVRLGTVQALEGVAVVAAATGRHRSAARLLAFAAAERDALGTPPSPVERPPLDRALAGCRAALGDAAVRAAMAHGRFGDQPEILAEVARVGATIEAGPQDDGGPAGSDPPAPAPAPDPAAFAALGLTRRQGEVLRLMADGLSDREIADALFITAKTASNHVGAVLAKLGVDSRTAAAAHAIRAGLV